MEVPGTPRIARFASPTRVPRGDLDNAGDFTFKQGCHAQIPAHGAGHLGDEGLDELFTGCHCGTIAVGQQRGGRVGYLQGYGEPLPVRARRVPLPRCGMRQRPSEG